MVVAEASTAAAEGFPTAAVEATVVGATAVVVVHAVIADCSRGSFLSENLAGESPLHILIEEK